MTTEFQILDGIGQRLRDLVALEHALPAKLQTLVEQLADKEKASTADVRQAGANEPVSQERTGGCLCGEITFRLTAPPHEVDYCHCHSCRKHTGAPVSVFADCKRSSVEFTKGRRTLYQSSPGVHRGFCPSCGSTLTYEVRDEIHIHIGALDRPQDFPPHDNPSFPEERIAWLHVATHRKARQSE